MKRMATHLRSALYIAIITATLLALNTTTASAHAGHSHADEGVDAVTLMQVGGIVLALAVVYLVASRWYQERDTGSSRTADRDDAPEA